jgi:hypothetical protein
MSNALVPMNDIEKMGTAIAKSGLFGMKTPDQAVALMLIAQAEGMHPAIAARDYHVIQGRPALKADAMLARFQANGGKVNWDVYTDQEVKATFSHPAGGSITLSWTLEQAKRIGLAGKDNWKNYPRAMLRARVISEGIRTVYPGCVVGVYTPEEVQDFEPAKRPMRDMGQVEVVEEETREAFIESDELPPAGVDIWPLHVPGRDTMQCAGKEEWVEAFLMLVGKVANAKLSNDEKQAKVAQLRSANTTAFSRMGMGASTAIYRQITEILPPPEVGAENTKKWVEDFDKASQEPSAPQS